MPNPFWNQTKLLTSVISPRNEFQGLAQLYAEKYFFLSCFNFLLLDAIYLSKMEHLIYIFCSTCSFCNTTYAFEETYGYVDI